MSKLPPISRRALLISGGSALALTALSPKALLAQDATPVRGGTFRMGLKGGESSDTLDPALSLGGANSYALSAFGDRLLELDENSNLIPALAESWSSNDDASVWTFNIREGVKFHNGDTLTAEDVAATLRRHSDENSQSGALGIMRGITGIETDGNAVIITNATPNADLPYLMNDYHLVIQQGGGVDNPGDGMGTGAYRLTSAEPGVRYAFERFEDHWNPNAGHYDTVELLIINDDTARVAALQSGQVHAIDRVPPRIAPRIDSVPGVRIDVVNGPGHYIFVMHTDTPPFDNADLRNALKFAINREEMVATVLNGYGSVANDIPINSSYPLFDADRLEQRAFDLDKARELYEASGHDGSPIILHVSDAAFAGALDAAQLFQQSANAAGIPLQLQREPADGYWSEVWNVKPFCASFWSGRATQDQMWSTGYLSTADWNDTNFNNAEFDELLLAARGETNEDTRRDMYGRMAEIVHEDGGLINPMFNQFLDGYSERVAGALTYERPLMDGSVMKYTWFAS